MNEPSAKKREKVCGTHRAGASLLQILIFSAILLGMLITSMRMISDQSTSIHRLYINFDADQFIDTYAAHLSSRKHCTQTLQTLLADTPSSVGTVIPAIKAFDGTGSGRTVFTPNTGSSSTFGDVNITRLGLRRTSTAGKIQVLVAFSYKLNAITRTDQKSFLLSASLNGSNQVQECYYDEYQYSQGTCSFLGGTFNSSRGRCEGVFLPEHTVVGFFQDTCPEGWVVADGGISGRPDVRGRFIRGTNSTNTGLGTFQGYGIAHHTDHSGSHDKANNCNASGGDETGDDAFARNSTVESEILNTVTNTTLANQESRPVNMALTFCVREWP
ncbi:MAG: hypothetical protein HQK50_11525 [Oligoflexia bacterium]|nr:hypothetical protein [Oligoflexia bacterium]